MLTFDYDGKKYSYWTREDCEAKGIPENVIAAAELEMARSNMQCTRRQAKLALNAAGLLDDVEAWMDSTATPEMRIDWEDAQTFDRTYGGLVSAGAALGLTDSQIDDLFTTAMSL